MDYVIEASEIKKNYKKYPAVKGISFKVKRGEVFAFLGLNGAGKSTTINILCNILKKDCGTVIIDGFDIDKDPDKVKEKIGIVFQRSVLDNELTVLQNLISRSSLYPMTKQESTDQINHLIKLLDLTPILNRQYKNLSGGQKRKVDIARALLHKPKILFLDEPTTGLDPNTRIAVWDILNKLVQDENLTIFLTTHHMEEVSKVDYVVILDEGSIIAEGTPDYLKQKHTTDILRIISKKDLVIEDVITKLDKPIKYVNNAYVISIKDSLEGLAIINSNTVITNFEIIKGNMDHVFLNVTGKRLEANQDDNN